jgi:hypothetical protein
MEPDEFDCIDCNVHVYAWATSNRKRCMVCQWIYDTPNLTKEQIAEIRVMTATPILEKEDGNH